jgi:ABC-type polysaccharide/polyol phosphate export permease
MPVGFCLSETSQIDFSFSNFSVSAFVSVALCASGIWYFRKMERTFADVM